MMVRNACLSIATTSVGSAAIAAALRIEYETIVGAGFQLQIDAPDLALERHASFAPRPLKDFQRFVERVIGAINAALVNVPADKVRLHVCWGNYEGPHDHDVALADILPILMQAKVGGLYLPFANPRHAHEYKVFREQPLKADQVTAAGGVARSAGIPVIAFSNNSGAASPGVYLLNVLPESETRRSLGYVKRAGRKSYAGIFPNTESGRIQQQAFSQAASELGIAVTAVYNFTNETEARDQVAQIAPLLTGGNIDALFLPDRATAPSFGVLLEQAGVPTGKVQIIGSADWNNDPQILATPYLNGAIYPALDDKGYQAILPQYQQRFGGAPHPLVTVAYTAVILANASPLSQAQPKYNAQLLTAPGGFNGRDGVFRFLADGRSQYALVIKKISNGAASVVDGPKL